MQRNTLLIVIYAWAALLVFAGCGGGGNSNSTNPEPVSCVTEVDDDIDSDTVWGDECDTIRVVNSIDVHAALTILPGTIILMEEDVDINVDDGGSINAVGTEDSTIVFQGTSEVWGWWSGIAIETRDDKNVFEYVGIQHTGGVGFKNKTWGLTIAGGSTSPGALQMRHSSIRACNGPGLVIREGGELRGAADIYFGSIDNTPIMVAFSAVGDLHSSFRFAGVAQNILVTKGTIDSYTEMAGIGVPYRIQRECEIGEGGHLVIQPGAGLEFEQDVQLGTDEGAISILGTEDQPVELFPVERIPGYWGGIGFESLSQDNIIQHARISYAGSGFRGAWECAVFVSGNATTRGYVEMSNVLIREIDGDGIYIRNGGAYEMNNVTFEDISGDNIVDENGE